MILCMNFFLLLYNKYSKNLNLESIIGIKDKQGLIYVRKGK
jgi:hypothetical protein